MTRVDRAKARLESLIRQQHAAELTALTPDTEYELGEANRDYDRITHEIETAQMDVLDALCDAEEVTFHG